MKHSANLKILSDSFSIVGSKKLTFCNDSGAFLQFSDAGGIFGEPIEHVCSFADFAKPGNYLILTMDSDYPVTGKLLLPQGYVIFGCSKENSRLFLHLVIDFSSLDARPRIYLPARLDFEQCRRLLGKRDPDLKQGWRNEYSPDEVNSISSAMYEKNIWPMALEFSADKLKLLPLELEYQAAELPLSSLSVEREGGRLSLRTPDTLLAGVELSSFSIDFPNDKIAREYCAKFHLGGNLRESIVPPLDTLSGQAGVEGFVQAAPVSLQSCDMELGTGHIALFIPGASEAFVRFDFNDENLSVDGTSLGFIIGNHPQTVVRIKPESDELHQAIAENHLLQHSAYQAANAGPFISTTISGKPASVSITHDRVTLQSGSEKRTLSLADNPPAMVSREDGDVLSIGEEILHNQLPMMEGILSALTACGYRKMVAEDAESAFNRLQELESSYFSYTIFGHVVDAHLSLANTLHIHPIDRISQLEGDYEKNLFLAYMMQSAGNIALQLEILRSMLPAFVVERDFEFLSQSGSQQELRQSELKQEYAVALKSLGPLLEGLYRVDASVSRISALRRTLLKEEEESNLLPLGVSVIASVFHPIALVGIARHWLDFFSRGKNRAIIAQDTSEEIFYYCAKEWDTIVHDLLPAVASHILPAIEQTRSLTADCLREALAQAPPKMRQRFLELMAQRLARLSIFESFPAYADRNIKRSQSIAFVHESRQRAQTFLFRHF